MGKYKFVSPMWVIDSVLAGIRLDATDYYPNPQAPLGVSKPPTIGGATVALPNVMQVRPIENTSSSSSLRRIGDMMPQSVDNSDARPRPSLARKASSVSLDAMIVDESEENAAAVAPALHLRQAPTNEKLARPMPSWYASNQGPYGPLSRPDNIPNKPIFRPTSMGPEFDENGPGRMLTSKENPNFVSDYFASSRLHHLSRWRIDFQQQLTTHLLNLSPIDDENNKPGNRQHSALLVPTTVTPDRIIAHIDMDAFFVSVSSRNRADLIGKPVVVSHGGARGTCASVNYVARKLGVHNGWRLAEAERLCGEQLVVLPYDFEAYEQVSKSMYEVFLKYTKLIQVLSCDEALLDLTEAARSDYNAALSIATRIREEVKARTGCDCSAGVGSSRVAASLALRLAKPNGCIAAPPLLDKSSSDFALMSKMVSVGMQPNPLSSDLERALGGLNPDTISKSRVLSWLSQFKIEHMKGIGPAIEDKLEEMKITTVGELQLCPLARNHRLETVCPFPASYFPFDLSRVNFSRRLEKKSGSNYSCRHVGSMIVHSNICKRENQ